MNEFERSLNLRYETIIIISKFSYMKAAQLFRKKQFFIIIIFN